MTSQYLEKGKVTKIVLRLALPAMLAQLINVLYSIVDRIYISNLGDIANDALAGVGIAAPAVTFITSFSYLVGMGGAPLMTMSLGEGNKENARKILANAFLMLVSLGILIPIIILIFNRPILTFFGATDNTFIYSQSYLLFYLFGAPFALIAMGLNQFLISQGNSGKGMLTMIIGAVVNIILDPIFIFAFGLGVRGAAIATAISQVASFTYVFFMILKYSEVKVTFSGYSFRIIKKIFCLGFSPFIIAMTDSLVGLFLNSSIKINAKEESDIYITATTIASSFYQLFSMPLLGISGGTGAIISYCYGARETKRCKEALRNITLLALVFTTISFILSIFIAKPFMMLFTSDEKIINCAIDIAKVLMMMFILLSFQYVFVDSLTALGKPKYAITLSLIRKITSIAMVYVFPLFLGVMGCYYAQAFADLLASIITLITFVIVFKKILKKREESSISVLNVSN